MVKTLYKSRGEPELALVEILAELLYAIREHLEALSDDISQLPGLTSEGGEEGGGTKIGAAENCSRTCYM